ncbi:MAG TPA: hypothetical protein VK163_14500 [Opitutaceae bacterium]|nr:hypothetical protein [Opitutaceae bacterium]
MKTIPTDTEQSTASDRVSAGCHREAARFQIVVEYAPGVFISTASATTVEEAAEIFMKQPPGCEAGEINLHDRIEHRGIGSVKWTMEPTENGLRVPHRQNIFCDWNTALLALEVQRRVELESLAGTTG